MVAYATACYYALRNTVDLLIDGEAAWKKRFGNYFIGPSIPFGAEVLYKPSSKEGFKRVEEFGNKLLNGIFVGYVFHAGGGWTADILVVDQEEINVAKNRSECQPKRIKWKECVVVKKEADFVFPMMEYELSQPGNRPPYVQPERKHAEREHVPFDK